MQSYRWFCISILSIYQPPHPPLATYSNCSSLNNHWYWCFLRVTADWHLFQCAPVGTDLSRLPMIILIPVSIPPPQLYLVVAKAPSPPGNRPIISYFHWSSSSCHFSRARHVVCAIDMLSAASSLLLLICILYTSMCVSVCVFMHIIDDIQCVRFTFSWLLRFYCYLGSIICRSLLFKYIGILISNSPC